MMPKIIVKIMDSQEKRLSEIHIHHSKGKVELSKIILEIEEFISEKLHG